MKDVRTALKQIVATNGAAVLDDSKRTTAMLRDLCPEHGKEIAALTMALDLKVPGELRDSAGLPFEVVEGRLRKRMTDKYPINPDVARWAVQLLAEVLGRTEPAPKVDLDQRKRAVAQGEETQPPAPRKIELPKPPRPKEPESLQDSKTEPAGEKEPRRKWAGAALLLTGAALGVLLVGAAAWLLSGQGGDKDKQAATQKKAEPEMEKPKVITNSIGMKLVYVGPGKFLMGSPEDEKDRCANEGPQHEVEISKGFYIGVYEVTQGEWVEVMGENPSYFSATGEGKDLVKGLDTKKFPVETASWEDVQDFLVKLTARAKEKENKRIYRLPTEAEWEYTCRGGPLLKNKKSYPFHFGNQPSSEQANFGSNFGRTCEVGKYPANVLGVHDMHGNVWEWCEDWHDEKTYTGKPRIDPKGPAIGTLRVRRGGSWDFVGHNCRAAYRYGVGPADRSFYYGFRVVLVLPPGL